METTTLFSIINLLAVVGLAVLFLTRKSNSAPVDISKDLITHREELRSSISANHEIIEKRLASITESAENSAKANREEATQSRLELQKSLSESLKTLETDLERAVFGQDAAIKQLSSAMKMARAGLRDPQKPIGCYLFSGPTGVGKTEVAKQLADRAGGEAVAVLFYGSNLRDARLDGVLDFYVLLDRVGAWPGSRLAALANAVLPPNVGYFEGQVDETTLRAKFALISLAQFSRGVSPGSLDTTLWARFSQPCACVHLRGDADWAPLRDAVAEAAAELPKVYTEGAEKVMNRLHRYGAKPAN